jgi:mannose-1-phosphate guanylyltransferase/mannose-6-phosphate isomerase
VADEALAAPAAPPETVTVERPWGEFRQYCCNEPVTVKIITVKAGSELSLQRHRRRAELWVSLDGTLVVEVDGKRWQPATGEQVWIPSGAVHRLSAPADASGRMLEVAFGPFDEEDIERLADRYGRA